MFESKRSVEVDEMSQWAPSGHRRLQRDTPGHTKKESDIPPARDDHIPAAY